MGGERKRAVIGAAILLGALVVLVIRFAGAPDRESGSSDVTRSVEASHEREELTRESLSSPPAPSEVDGVVQGEAKADASSRSTRVAQAPGSTNGLEVLVTLGGRGPAVGASVEIARVDKTTDRVP